MKLLTKIRAAFSGKRQCSGWEPLPDESWEDETLRLLNEGELGEALKMFRQHHRMVNRFVCMDCGFTSPNFVHGKGCWKCESDKVETRVVIDPPNHRIDRACKVGGDVSEAD